MQTRSSLQRRSNSESSDRVVVHIKPRSWGDEIHQQPQTVQPQNTGFDFKNADWFSHDPGPRSPVRVFNTIQAKLTVGAPNDQYEQEADRVAEQVMSTPDSAVQQPIQRDMAPEEEKLQTKPLAATITPLVQREMAPEEEEPELIQGKLIQREMAPEEEEETEPVQGKLIQREAALEDEEETELVQGKPALQRKESSTGFQAQSGLEQQLDSSKGSGSPLPDDVRSFMEPRFGTDFSQVRVHTGNESVQMNRDLNAQAFAHKQDVYFGAGKAPAKDSLTAHELTHVVQQTGAVQTKAAPKPNVQLKCSVCEEEAKIQRSVEISSVSAVGVQRSWFGDDDDEKKEPEKSSGGGILDWAKEKASGAVDTVTQAGSDAYDWTKEKGSAAVDTVTQAGSDAYDWAKEKASAAVDTVTQAGSGAYTNQITGTPGAPDPCLDLLQQIIELLNELAKRINDALNDPHELFKYHRKTNNSHPDGHGSWDGHRDRYYYDRDRLRQKIAEWESSDDCKGYPLTQEQRDELTESEEFKEKDFPEKPAPAMFEMKEEEGLQEKIAEALREAGVPAVVVGGLVVLIIVALVDPEPFSKVALLIGTAAAVAFFILIGRQSDIPSSTATASISSTNDEDSGSTLV